jgi:hypothetical protein
MSADAVLVVADTLREHQWRGNFLGCGCGWNWPEELTHFCGEDERIAKAHASHVAAAVVDALGGLEREWGSQMLGDDEITIGSEGTARFCAQQHPLTWTALLRWVSGWVREPAEEDRDA